MNTGTNLMDSEELSGYIIILFNHLDKIEDISSIDEIIELLQHSPDGIKLYSKVFQDCKKFHTDNKRFPDINYIISLHNVLVHKKDCPFSFDIVIKIKNELRTYKQLSSIRSAIENNDLSKIRELVNTEEPILNNSTDILSLIKNSEQIKAMPKYEFLVKNPDTNYGVFARKAMTIIFSKQGRGKTFLNLDIAKKLSTGKSIFNTLAPEEALKILYINADADTSLISTRTEQMNMGDLSNILYLNKLECSSKGIDISIDKKSGRYQLEKVIKNGNYDLVIIDTLTHLTSSDFDSNSGQVCKEVTDYLREIASTYNLHVICNLHCRKRQHKDSQDILTLDDLKGATELTGCFYDIWAINPMWKDKEPIPSVGLIKSAKSWGKTLKPIQYKITEEPENNIELIYSIPEENNSFKEAKEDSNKKQKLYSILKEIQGEFSKSELKSKYYESFDENINDAHLSREIQNYQILGYITTTGKGNKIKYTFKDKHNIVPIRIALDSKEEINIEEMIEDVKIGNKKL